MHMQYTHIGKAKISTFETTVDGTFWIVAWQCNKMMWLGVFQANTHRQYIKLTGEMKKEKHT